MITKELNSKTFYHGTTDTFNVGKYILPPVKTENKREEWRMKYTDKVFFTTSMLSAEMYAKKACKKYGGNPVIYVVKPVGQYFSRMNTEYIADKALVVGFFDKSA